MKTFMQPLDAKEEAHCIFLLRKGNEQEAREAKKRLIEHNLRLVAHIIKKYQNVNEDMDDLLSVGTIGLIKAIDTFDAGKGRLATYACRCIDNEVLMLLRNKKKNAKEYSLYDSIGQDKEGNEICLVDVLVQEQKDIVEQIDLADKKKRLLQYLDSKLNKRERDIIMLRYGLTAKGCVTQHDIGKSMGISRSYVSRIEKRALRKLRMAFDTKNT